MLFYTSQITIVIDPADQERGCTLIRACTLNRSNAIYHSRIVIFFPNFTGLTYFMDGPCS